jgi:hypothetical protein
MERNHNWYAHLDGFGRRLLADMGIHSPQDLTGMLGGMVNALTEALKGRLQWADADSFVQWGESKYGKDFNRTSLSRAATICQMAVYDKSNGPDGDGKEKALRRHWYHWFKVHFAQPLALALGDFEVKGGNKVINDTAWSQRLSVTYAELVDSGEVTYKDLWVEDASRMITRTGQTLFDGFKVLLAVEKDSLFADFIPAAKAAGFAVVMSGKGKNSKAAIEKVLRDTWSWPGYTDWDGQFTPVFTEDEPLIILHISDYDYDGEAVIGPTFGSQAQRYTDYIMEARVGVQPEGAVLFGYDLGEVSYQVKLTNGAYVEWAHDKAIFAVTCSQCGKSEIVVGDPEVSGQKSDCCWAEFDPIKVGGKDSDTAFGLEVESMRTRDYYALIIRALLRVVDFDYIVERLRKEAVADASDAAYTVARETYDESEGYQELQKAFEKLEEQKSDFEQLAQYLLQQAGEPHVSDFEDQGDDPTPEDFEQHVISAHDYSSPWRPFERYERTQLLVEWLRKNEADLITRIGQAFVATVISEAEWYGGEYTRFIVPDTADEEKPTEGQTMINGQIFDVRYDEDDEVWRAS